MRANHNQENIVRLIKSHKIWRIGVPYRAIKKCQKESTQREGREADIQRDGRWCGVRNKPRSKDGCSAESVSHNIYVFCIAKTKFVSIAQQLNTNLNIHLFYWSIFQFFFFFFTFLFWSTAFKFNNGF